MTDKEKIDALEKKIETLEIAFKVLQKEVKEHNHSYVKSAHTQLPHCGGPY